MVDGVKDVLEQGFSGCLSGYSELTQQLCDWVSGLLFFHDIAGKGKDKGGVFDNRNFFSERKVKKIMAMSSRKKRLPMIVRVVERNFPIQRKRVARAAKIFFMDVWAYKGKEVCFWE
jgi:hypothetical protein